MSETFKYTQTNLFKIQPVSAEFFHGDGWAEGHDEANSRFSQFCERAVKRTQCLTISYEFYNNVTQEERVYTLMTTTAVIIVTAHLKVISNICIY